MNENFLNEILNEIKHIKEQTKENSKYIEALLHRVEEDSAQITSVSENINYIQGDIQHIKKDIKRLADIQARQEKILERLALRSIEQEADIEELRKIR
jgi:peptidoglycan hydrolase CwlO-like protein